MALAILQQAKVHAVQVLLIGTRRVVRAVRLILAHAQVVDSHSVLHHLRQPIVRVAPLEVVIQAAVRLAVAAVHALAAVAAAISVEEEGSHEVTASLREV